MAFIYFLVVINSQHAVLFCTVDAFVRGSSLMGSNEEEFALL